MIEVNLAELSKVLLQHLEILAAVRCLCLIHGQEVDWIVAWEREVGGLTKGLRLARGAKGDVLILED